MTFIDSTTRRYSSLSKHGTTIDAIRRDISESEVLLNWLRVALLIAVRSVQENAGISFFMIEYDLCLFQPAF